MGWLDWRAERSSAREARSCGGAYRGLRFLRKKDTEGSMTGYALLACFLAIRDLFLTIFVAPNLYDASDRHPFRRTTIRKPQTIQARLAFLDGGRFRRSRCPSAPSPRLSV